MYIFLFRKGGGLWGGSISPCLRETTHRQMDIATYRLNGLGADLVKTKTNQQPLLPPRPGQSSDLSTDYRAKFQQSLEPALEQLLQGGVQGGLEGGTGGGSTGQGGNPAPTPPAQSSQHRPSKSLPATPKHRWNYGIRELTMTELTMR